MYWLIIELGEHFGSRVTVDVWPFWVMVWVPQVTGLVTIEVAMANALPPVLTLVTVVWEKAE